MQQVIVDQEGVVLDVHTINQEKFKDNLEWLTDKLPEFEEALSKACFSKNEVYNKLGFHQQANAELYQIGMRVLGLTVDSEGLSWQEMGYVG